MQNLFSANTCFCMKVTINYLDLDNQVSAKVTGCFILQIHFVKSSQIGQLTSCIVFDKTLHHGFNFTVQI